jgi:hypothetical protein
MINLRFASTDGVLAVLDRAGTPCSVVSRGATASKSGTGPIQTATCVIKGKQAGIDIAIYKNAGDGTRDLILQGAACKAAQADAETTTYLIVGDTWSVQAWSAAQMAPIAAALRMTPFEVDCG